MSAEEIIFSGWNIALSLFISILGGSVVAGIFFLKFKPKSEQLFEDNRQSNLEMIFGPLDMYETFHIQYVFKAFVKEFGPLEDGREELVPTMKFVPIKEIENQEPFDIVNNMKDEKKLAMLKENLDGNVKTMDEIYNFFRKDYQFFSHYLPDSFLRDVNEYYLSTNYYVNRLFHNQVYEFNLVERKKRAEQIMKYLKETKGIDENQKSIKKFIDVWEKTLKELQESQNNSNTS